MDGDADEFKTKVSDAFTLEGGKADSMVLYSVPETEPLHHNGFAVEVCSERSWREWDTVKGWVTRWVKVEPQNHKLDCCWMGIMGLDYLDADDQRRRDRTRGGSAASGNWFDEQS